MEHALAQRRRIGLKRVWLVALVGLLGTGSDPTTGEQPRGGPAPVSWDDPRFAPLRDAAAGWGTRDGPNRAVVDQVCLVPDLATFLEAVKHWDRQQFFPILIEDAESNLRFLRAFHPARVVRYPKNAEPIAPDQSWAAAVTAVTASWREPGAEPAWPKPNLTVPAAAKPPESLGPTPPGVVVSNPDSSMLAGAVALAAGRCQPLVRLDSTRGYWQTLTLDEFRQFDRNLTAAVAGVAPRHDRLGDDCDFVTVAGNYPYRYRDEKGDDEAVDDGIARGPLGSRWAYTGRILGNPATSLYQAMCALFLQPDAVTMFNGYDETNPPWSSYSTSASSLQLAREMNSASDHRHNRNASVAGWHEAFDPENRSSLVWINSHGSPTIFHLWDNEPASTTDIPRTVPAAVVMIHSFSAADPVDPATIAGRWLSNGAFVYFGAINEPFLQAFRTPELAIDLLAGHLPLAAVLRNTAIEPFGTPWRLEYLGDPLFRLKPRRSSGPHSPDGQSPRVATQDSTQTWPEVVLPDLRLLAPSEFPNPHIGPESTLRAGLDAAFALMSQSGLAPNDSNLAATIAGLAQVERDRLDHPDRRVLDSVLADLLFFARRRSELRAWIEAIPPTDRSAELARWLDALRGIDFAWVLAGDDFDRIVSTWSRIIRAPDALNDFRTQATARVGALANDPDRRSTWAQALRSARNECHHANVPDFLAKEQERNDEAIRLDQNAKLEK